MNERDYEILSQFIDNELDSEAAQTLRKRLLAEPDLRAELDHMRVVNDHVKGAFDAPGSDAVPASVVASLQPRTDSPRLGGSWGMAIAASLAVAAGLVLVPQWQENLESQSSDPLLANVMEQSSSRTEGWDFLPDGRKVRPVLSFYNQDGNWCREYFVDQAGQASRGVACREDGSWNSVVLVSADLPGSTTEYRPAGAAQADQVASYINQHAADIPLSVDQEADLIARGWQ